MSNNVPPLDMDLNTVDISFPLLADNFYDVRITKAEMKSNSSGGRMIALELKNTSPAQGRKGESVNAEACALFHNINIAPSGKSTWEIVARSAGELIQAIPGGVPGANLGNVDTWVPQLLGKQVRVRVGYEPAGSKNGKTYREKNVVAYFVKAGQQQ